MTSDQQTNLTIPLLPCTSIDEQLDFYRALGFEITYQQSKPNLYACVKHSFTELHFFVVKQLNPAESYSMCYIRVSDVDALYQQLLGNLKKIYGKIPSRGIPRITKLNNLSEDRRFNIVDPGGNRLMIGQKLEPSERNSNIMESQEDTTSKLAKAYKIAYKLAYAKVDAEAAAKILDAALARNEPISALLSLKALVLRADVAVSMDDRTLARNLMDEARQISLTDQEREVVKLELERRDDIEAMLQ